MLVATLLVSALGASSALAVSDQVVYPHRRSVGSKAAKTPQHRPERRASTDNPAYLTDKTQREHE